MSAPSDGEKIPETHEKIRNEDLRETLEIFRQGNDVIPPLPPEHLAWLETALQERQYLCSHQYKEDGTVDRAVLDRLQVLDGHINSVSPHILQVLHYLSRVRAIIPVLLKLRQTMQEESEDPNQKMIRQMQYECSKAEVQSAIEGLAALRVRPGILDQVS
jgi:hypothetical protein